MTDAALEILPEVAVFGPDELIAMARQYGYEPRWRAVEARDCRILEEDARCPWCGQAGAPGDVHMVLEGHVYGCAWCRKMFRVVPSPAVYGEVLIIEGVPTLADIHYMEWQHERDAARARAEAAGIDAARQPERTDRQRADQHTGEFASAGD